MADGKGRGDVPDVRDLDVVFWETDRLYYRLVSGCGLSETAYWVLYDLLVSGGSIAMRDIVRNHFMARQTASSTVKSLEQRGLVELGYVPGSGKSKLVSLTAEGSRFCDQRIQPAVDAEERAFRTLPVGQRREFVRIAREYASNLRAEFDRMEGGEGR